MSENRSEMEGNFNGVLHDTRKVEEESSSEDKEVAVEVYDDDDDVYDGKSKCVSDEHVEACKVVEEEEDVNERVGESLESSNAIGADRVEDIEDSETVELEFKEEKVEDGDVVDETELAASKENNEGIRESEVVETVRDVTVGEDENVLSTLPSLDVVSVSRESDDVVEKVISPKGVEESLGKSTYEKDEEQLDVQESSSAYESAKESFQPSSNAPCVNEQEESSAYESAKESLQPSSNVHDSENISVNEQDRVEESRGIENQGVIYTFITVFIDNLDCT